MGAGNRSLPGCLPIHKDLFEDDRKALLPFPSVATDESELKVVRANSYSKFTLNKGKRTCSAAPCYASSQVFPKLTAHEVIASDKNYREIMRHLWSYGNHRQESMDWLSYLPRLSRPPAALKYTGIYPMLSQEVPEFLDTRGYHAKEDTLKGLAKLSEGSSFSKAAEVVLAAVSHGARDVDSVSAIFNRLNSDIVGLDSWCFRPMLLRYSPLNPDLNNCDNEFLRGGGRTC